MKAGKRPYGSTANSLTAPPDWIRWDSKYFRSQILGGLNDSDTSWDRARRNDLELSLTAVRDWRLFTILSQVIAVDLQFTKLTLEVKVEGGVQGASLRWGVLFGEAVDSGQDSSYLVLGLPCRGCPSLAS